MTQDDRDRPWVEAQALDDAADDLLEAFSGDHEVEPVDVFFWLTNRSANLRREAANR